MLTSGWLMLLEDVLPEAEEEVEEVEEDLEEEEPLLPGRADSVSEEMPVLLPSDEDPTEGMEELSCIEPPDACELAGSSDETGVWVTLPWHPMENVMPSISTALIAILVMLLLFIIIPPSKIVCFYFIAQPLSGRQDRCYFPKRT